MLSEVSLFSGASEVTIVDMVSTVPFNSIIMRISPLFLTALNQLPQNR